MVTEVIYYIGAGHARPGYDTIAAWETGTQIDCVSSGVVIIGELITDGTYDEDSLTFAGATTDADHYRVLRADSSIKHTGTRGTGPVVYSDLGGSAAVINIQEDYFHCHDIEISSDGNVDQYGIFTPNTPVGVHVSGILCYDLGRGGIYIQGEGTATNCIVHHTAAGAAKVGAFQGDSANILKFHARHCSALAETTDNNKDTTGYRYMVAKNCISMHYGGSAGHKDYLNMGAGTANNVSSDDSADDFSSSGLVNRTATDFFVNVTSGASTDLHLKSTAPCRGSGIGIAAGISGVPFDIDGEGRPLVWPDIGADEFIDSTPVGSGLDASDNDLVFLYRYTGFADGTLTNFSTSPQYTTYNTMSVSGSASQPVKVLGPGDGPPGAPSSSGAEASGTAFELFHIPATPAQSGNASGIDFSTTQSWSFGGWFLHGNHGTSQNLTYMGKHSFGGGNVRSFALSLQSGASSPQFAWRAQIGTSNGTSSTAVRSPNSPASGRWEHVVCTVDTSTASNNIRLYTSGQLVASGSATVSPGTSGAHPPFRLFGDTSTSEGLFNGVANTNRGGVMAETFLIRRNLNIYEVSGVYMSGFAGGLTPSPTTGIFQSDLNDTLKDNVGDQSSSASVITMTSWNANERADPSGFRHMTSGYHPAWEKILGVGTGLNFGTVTQNSASGIKAVTFRNATPETAITNMRFWSDDLSAFAGINGYEISMAIDSKWLPNLTLPSGSGTVGSTLVAASSILQSDLGTVMSGATLGGTLPSGESGISQYIYLSFNTNNDFTPSTYGPAGFRFRLTVDSA